MKTRTLMLLALACGVAIMAAGAVFLIQLSNQDEAEQPTPIGDEVTVGDMRVIVDGSQERDGVLEVALDDRRGRRCRRHRRLQVDRLRPRRPP